MLRKLAALLLLLTLLCGCGAGKSESGRLQIVAALFPAYDFARQVFGDKADVTLLLKPGSESHSYDPSARDIVKIDKCGLFICGGGESDAWVDTVLKSADEVRPLKMMSLVEPLEEEELPEINGEHDRDDEETEYDEHVWTSPKNAALIVMGIKEEAIRLDPANAAYYEKNAEDYCERINDLDRRFSELLSGEERYFVFGDRFPLLYFFKGYGLNYYAAFPGCGAETEPSAQTIAFLTERLKHDDTVNAVFTIELSDRRLAQTLAVENGLETLEFHACHNITPADFEAGETYVSLMERNYETLKKAVAL